jgi:cation diffusion facilitator CzcD-associated flavoprotein CzcO
MDKVFKWAVIGAGVAGISAIGALLDNGVHPEHIAWIDPAFKSGDLHSLWPHVSSNTTVNDFKNALNECAAFKYESVSDNFDLNSLEGKDTCLLKHITAPLQSITDNFLQMVTSFKSKVHQLDEGTNWSIKLEDITIHADKVILAVGSEQKALNLHNDEQKIVRLEDALSQDYWQGKIDKPIAVFGSSHSAMIVIKNIIEAGGSVINFYRSPTRYAIKLSNWTLYDNTGLKGKTAEWVKNTMPKHDSKIQRYHSNNENISLQLPNCDFVNYAIGFKPRLIPINGHIVEQYDDYHGIVANKLFATGLAFPRKVIYPTGYSEHNVGFLKFVRDLKELMPIWLQ